MVIDASAICAIVFDEPERGAIASLMAASSRTLMSPIQLWEAAVSISRRTGCDGMAEVALIREQFGIDIASLAEPETQLAFEAWRRFGKGQHPFKLNLGDCFAYGLAKSRDLPLLYKGEDFAMTDVRPAI